MKYRGLLASMFLAALGTVALAQTETPQIASKGVINGMAISLPKPAFPPTAMAVGAGGAVNVQVTIDMEGNVIEAAAISGHPLLRTVSVDASKKAKFKPTTHASTPIKITGIIVYNFAGSGSHEPMTWKQIGYEMSVAEAADTLSYKFPVSRISASFPADWRSEKIDLMTLQMKVSGNDTGKLTIASGSADVAPTVVDAAYVNHKTVLSSLKIAVENRLAGDAQRSSDFRVGTMIGKVNTQTDDDETLRAALAELMRLANHADVINAFSDLANKKSYTMSDRAQIRGLFEKLLAN